ncbi:MAG: endonuclease/exonuclease/phosphatase family protein [Bacteroidales bacterium]|nr:endonuclease/exonuclease/phosphatase family protein [Bacteroidales bacterium]
MRRLFRTLSVIVAVITAVSCSKTDEITLISYNIRNSGANDGINSWENRKDLTINMINQEKPDLICMQEVLTDQLEFVYDELPDYDFIGVGRDDSVRRGEIMAIFYRNDIYRLLGNGNFWLSETPDKVSRGWDGACRRMVTWGHFENLKSGKTFFCFNTHLDHKGAVARKESIRLIIEKINEITNGGPIFLTGDFNATIDNPIFIPLINYMHQARTDSPVSDSKNTYNNYGLGREAPSVIDHIFYMNAVPVSFATMDGNYGDGYISDHFPVKAVFRIE